LANDMSGADIFLSYAKEDQERAESLAEALVEEGWSVFWDRTVPAGHTWDDYIGANLDAARCVLVAWSKASVESEWVREEAREGRERKALVPVLFEKVRPPFGFRGIQSADLSAWDGGTTASVFQQLVADMSRKLGPPPADEEQPPAPTATPPSPRQTSRVAPGATARRGWQMGLGLAGAAGFIAIVVLLTTQMGQDPPSDGVKEFTPPICTRVAGAEPKVDACSLRLTKESLNEIIDTYRRLGRSKREERDPRRELQRGLEAVFQDNPEFKDERENTPLLLDGIIGPETLRWLQGFCREFPFSGSPESVPDNVMRSALHYAEIAAKHQDWKQTVTGPEFNAWVGESPGDGQINTRQIRRSGTVPVVISLLGAFASRSVEGGRPRVGAYDESCRRLREEGVVNNVLNSFTDLDRFEEKGKNLREELERGLDEVFAGNPKYPSKRERTSLLSDGPIGMKTGERLVQFCRDFPVSGPLENVPLRVVESALHYAEIAAARPDWREVLTDPRFNQWVQDPVPAGQTANRQLRLSGSAPIVIELIDEYACEVVPRD